MKTFQTLFAATAGTVCALIVVPDARAACDFSAASASMQALLLADGITDGGLLVGSPQGIWFKQYYGGNYSDATAIPLASATKLLSGVRMMQLVDKGILNLDTPVSSYLSGANFPWSNTVAPTTLRQMFSHTAGYGDDEDDILLDPYPPATQYTLEKSVEQIASNFDNLSPQNYLPVGSQFAYGGVSMQIGGEVAQMQTGADWEQSWKTDIGAPMCISTIDWQGLGPTLNYRIAGGAQTSLDDYARVLQMLASGGVGNGTRILSSSAIATLNHSQTGNATLGYAPAAANGSTQYGIGAWIETDSVSTDAPVIESIGAYGFTPWIDFGNGFFGVIMVEDNDQADPNAASINSRAAMLAIITSVRDQLRNNNGTCVANPVYDNIFIDAFETAPPAPQCPGTVAP
jgi:CubicO group peptidase (beta-lactamase class C family)